MSQDNIQDGLKVLPVNVMACKKMLVLFGSSYSSRLWCAWELFTLFSFQGRKQALASVDVIPLITEDLTETENGLLGMLKTFDVCYGPTLDPQPYPRLDPPSNPNRNSDSDSNSNPR